MLLRRHLRFKTHANDAFSGESEESRRSGEAEGHRIKSPQDCRRFKVRMRRRGRVLLERSRKSGKRSFGEQAEHDASSCRDANLDRK